MEDDKEKYLEILTKVLRECMEGESAKHALIIVSNDDREMLSLYSVNAHEDLLPPLLRAAAQVVMLNPDQAPERTLN